MKNAFIFWLFKYIWCIAPKVPYTQFGPSPKSSTWTDGGLLVFAD